ncbi:hypothetical protein EJ04DRAFT_504484 [Polyplosphaeria fusca]|uniref:Uncharacterized protein n=1 Tax=Polyplosphaeria fusca TaxID=682080 RepID=A0A9P4QNV6_9PLEO|nr:hypothetical protein EJ04DRAFT_504484 [Polyplosphaeria fusca]
MAATAIPTTPLSQNDTRILQALFDPEPLPSQDVAPINPSLPSLPALPEPTFTALEAGQTTLILTIESNPTVPTLASALSQLDTTISQTPLYPSAYLNRAMLSRMHFSLTSPDTPLPAAPHPFLAHLFTDLARAIHLASPSSPTDAASPYQARILRTAYTHRAYLYLKCAEQGGGVEGRDAVELEELASKDFGDAVRWGAGGVERDMWVRTNPWRRMCGGIVREAIEGERGEC